MEKEEIKKYYEKADLWLPTRPEERVFKFQLSNNKFIQVKEKITNIEDLRTQLLRYLPISVWYSTSVWNKKKFIYNDLAFDIDCKEIELKEAKTIAFKIACELQDKFRVKYCLFSGNGFHLVYDGKCKDIKNVRCCMKHRNMLVNELKQVKGLKDIDYKTTIDPKRFIRLPQTIHNNGNIAIIIEIRKLVDRSRIDFITSIKVKEQEPQISNEAQLINPISA